MSNPSHRDPAVPQRHTALAFLLAPGIAALAGGLGASFACLCAHPIDWGAVFVGPVVFSFFFALVGYPTAATLGVPAYLVLPEAARRAFAVVVPMAGAIAAAPWCLVAAPWRAGPGELSIVGIAFVLGAIGGIAFLFIRRPRAATGDARTAGGALPDRRAAVDAL